MSQTTKISQLYMYDLFLIGMKAQPHIFDKFFGNPWEILVVFFTRIIHSTFTKNLDFQVHNGYISIIQYYLDD